MKDLRQSCRVPYGASIEISWRVDDQLKWLHATCVDISLGGLSVQTEDQIPVHTPVTLDIHQIEFSGAASVRHVTARGSQFIVGLELSPETRDRIFSPREKESV